MQMLQQLLEFKQSERKWHFPVIAGLSIGTPLLGGYFTGNMQGGNMASMGGFVYTYSLRIVTTMITLMACSFGIMISFSVGMLFGFNPFVASLVLGCWPLWYTWPCTIYTSPVRGFSLAYRPGFRPPD